MIIHIGKMKNEFKEDYFLFLFKKHIDDYFTVKVDKEFEMVHYLSFPQTFI